MLKGRLGLETARVPHADRHGLLWLGRGKLSVEDGCLRFVTTGSGDLKEGVYQIAFQGLSFILLGPGTTVSHDALRLLARHKTGLLAVGENGVRFYASMPFGPDNSTLARRQAMLWADEGSRKMVARAMYIRRFGAKRPQMLPKDLNALRGLEGQRVRALYKKTAAKYGITWTGRSYDRKNPEQTDLINQAINHAATAIKAAAMVAVSITGTLAPLGFVHEASGQSFALDIADLYRADLVLPIAFEAYTIHMHHQGAQEIERITRKLAGTRLQGRLIIPDMITAIKELLNVDDSGRDQ